MKALLMYVLAAFFVSNSSSTTNPGKKTKNDSGKEMVVAKDITIATPEGPVTLRSGTPVVIETIQTLNAKNLSEGQTVNVRVKYNVVVTKQTVIAAGALGNATISEISKPGIFGKPGRIELQIQSIQAVDGQQILVSGMPMISEGQNRRALAWSLSVGLLILTLIGGAIGFFIKGKNAELKAGTGSNASVASDAQIDVDEK